MLTDKTFDFKHVNAVEKIVHCSC